MKDKFLEWEERVFTAPYRWLSVKVDGVVIPDNNGNTALTNSILSCN